MTSLTRKPVRLPALWFVVAVTGGCASSTGGRYEAAGDPGSRRDWKYVSERETKRWVNRACEVRVSVDRPLPDPLQDRPWERFDAPGLPPTEGKS